VSVTETPVQLDAPPTTASNARNLALGLLPLGLLALVLLAIVLTDGGLGARATPPIETLSVQRVTLPEPNRIVVKVVNDGPDPVTIAQVLVDDAYWQFSMAPDTTLGRLESADVSIPYPWVEAEAHHIGLVSSNGVIFPAEVAVAVQSPERDGETVARFALIGLYVGVVPIAIGLLWYPFLRRRGPGALRFILALTIGLLVFLVVDMWEEARETALTAPSAYKGPLLVPLVAALTALLLLTLSASKGDGPRRGLGVAYRIALGIGLHNLGEGLAIGAAFALGEVALGVFLVVGFTLHNVTEGVGIAAPILRERPALSHFARLALLAGAPAILGVWIGGFAPSPLWTTLFLAVGIGAIAQVIVEVARLLVAGARRAAGPALDWTTLGGVTAGVGLMYATALLVA
jgi:zinc transporter, ZIP family